MRLIIICKYSMISRLPESVTLTHLAVMFFARRLFRCQGVSNRSRQHEIQFTSTIATAIMAEKVLKARVLTAIQLKYYFFII